MSFEKTAKNEGGDNYSKTNESVKNGSTSSPRAVNLTVRNSFREGGLNHAGITIDY